MTVTHSRETVSRLPGRIVAAAVLCAVGVGSLGLLGYAVELRPLARLVPAGPVMMPGAAMMFVLSGISLWLIAPTGSSRSRRRSGQTLAWAVALFGMTVLVEYATGRGLGIDNLTFVDQVRAWSDAPYPGRSSPHAALAFTVTGLAMALLDADGRGGHRPAQLLAPAGALVAGMVLLGQAYGLAYLHGKGTPYAAAATFLLLSVALLAARPARPMAQVFLGNGPGADTVRRIGPVVGSALLLVGVLLSAIGRYHLPDEVALVAAVTGALVLMLYLLFVRVGIGLDRDSRVQRDLLTALRAERDLGETVLGSLREGVLIAAPDGQVIRVNSSWCEITGYPAMEVVGCRPPYPWLPDDRAPYLLDTDDERDRFVQRLDGTAVAVQVMTSLLRDGEGPVRWLVTSYRDVTARNLVEEERRRAAEQLDHFFTMSTDLLCIAGTDGYFKHLNPAWERTLGYTLDELQSRPFTDFMHPDDVGHTILEMQEQLTLARATVAFENRYRRRDGRYLWLNWSSVPTAHDGLIYAVARDTTAQREIDDARARLATIVDCTNDAIISESLDGTITSWNPAAERIYGYSAEEMVGRSIHVLVPPGQGREIDDFLARVARGDSVSLPNTVRIRKDGSRMHVDVSNSPIRDSGGTVVGVASIARDITGRTQAEDRFRQLVLNAPDAMVVVDQTGTIVLVNEQAEEMFGYRYEDMIGRPVELLIPQPVHHQHVSHRQGYFVAPSNRRMSPGMELTALCRNGSEVPVEINLNRFDTDQGILVSASIRDISERQQVVQALAAARDEALAAAQLKSQFVATVSHEIRTPMNGVIGLTGLLLETPLEPAQRRYAEAIRVSGRALLTIINDILDFSKIEAGRIELVEADFDLDQILDEVVQVAAEAGRDKDIELLCDYPADLPLALRGDAGRLRQVILNLMGNAVKFTESGEVRLRVAAAPGGDFQLTFTVSDTGIGIADADLPQLFEPFSQVDSALDRQFGGTGLGLTIARQMIELMGGALTVDSEFGQGSRFAFTLPFRQQPGRADRTTAYDVDLSGRRLLIVDDNRACRDLLTEQTRAWGMVSTAVADAGGALACLRRPVGGQGPYDVALIDQRMPGLDGTDLINRVSADPTIASVRIVLMTSGTYQDDKIAEGLDVVAPLAKPVSPARLYDCLVGLLHPGTSPVVEQRQSAPVPEQAADSRGVVLLAEDNAINQMVALDTLATLGYRADVARNGLEVLELAAAHPYQAILMDCQMPKMDGYAATAALRLREDADQHIPIIAMTAGALAEDRQRCLAAGMDDYLAKPIDPDELRAVLDRWANRDLAEPR